MVELLVATICLAVTALGILTAISFASTQNKLARERMTALSIASSEMEKFRSKAFYGSVAPETSNIPIAGSGLSEPASLQTTVTSTGDPRVFTITVKVSWTVTLQSGDTVRAIKLDSAMRNSDES